MPNTSQTTRTQHLSATDALKLLAERRNQKATTLPQPAIDGESVRPGAVNSEHIAAELKTLVLSVLKLPEAEFSPSTSLLEYGLDSISATELGARFTERFKITLPPTIFFEFPDVQGFSRYLAENHGDDLQDRFGETIAAAPSGASPKSSHFSADRLKAVPREQQHEVPMPAANGALDQARADAPDANLQRERPRSAGKLAERAKDNKGDGLLTIEQLWSESERVIGAGPPVTRAREVKQPSRADLQRMLEVAERATVVTIQRSNRRNLECAVFGEGPPVLMLGGLLMHYTAMWRTQIEALGSKYRMIMFHMPGCGGVELHDGLSLASLVEDVKDALDGLGIYEPIPVVGCSFGGVLAQSFCIAHPERCKALSLTVTTPIAEGATDFQKLMRELQSSSSFMEVNRAWPMGALSAYSNVIEDFDLRNKLGGITVPALIMSGGNDQYTPASFSRIIADRIPSSELIEFEDAGHLLPFTHYERYNAELLKFLARVTAPGKSLGMADARTKVRAPLPVTAKTLEVAEAYVRSGQQGHCVILPEAGAKAAFLLNNICRSGKDGARDSRSYFVPSMEEALDAAIRLARHNRRNQRSQSSGTVLVLDANSRWLDYFNPQAHANGSPLVPGIEMFSSADTLRARLQSGGDIAAVALCVDAEPSPEALDALVAASAAQNVLSILVETEMQTSVLSNLSVARMRVQPDLVVFGELIAGFQAPVAAFALKDGVSNPWLMTPNEGYARQPMAAHGFPLTLAYQHLAAAFASDPTLMAALNAIGVDQGSVFDAHIKYGNAGYARVARMHGYDGRFHDAFGMRSKFTPRDGSTREIIDCLQNVGTAPRGLNAHDIADDVLKRHDPQHNYWADLSAWLRSKTGFDVVLPSASQTRAIEQAVTTALLAAGARKKMLCFSGGAGFSMISAATAHDPLFDLFRRPFQPLYPDVVFIDPSADDAEERLRRELRSGDLGLVWVETHQVEGNAIRPLPENLMRAITEHREEGGYLVGVDETQTNLWTGRLLQSAVQIPSPDVVAVATALCDSLLPAGAVLTHGALFERARQHNPRVTGRLQSSAAFPLTAHLALHALKAIYDGPVLGEVQQKGEYFKQQIDNLPARYPLLRAARGEGLLLAIEFDLTGYSEFVQRSFGYLLWGAMLRDPEGGVAAVVCPIHNNCLRIVPALTITYAEIDLIVANISRRVHAGVEGIIRDCATYNRSLGDGRTADFLLTQIETGQRRTMTMDAISLRTKGAPDGGIPPLRGVDGLPSVCIIGAGTGGISMAGALKKKGIPFDCFDKREKIGGIWAFDEKRQNTSVWHALNMNTPRGWYQFSDFPMPKSYPDYPQWHQTHAYLERYIDHLNMRSSFHLGQEVVQTTREKSGRWRVELASGEVRYYDAIIVANGHHNQPNFPDYADKISFNGTAIHSQHYRYRQDYRDKRVMVVGIGNSGAQIAVDVSFDAKMTYISMRRGVYLLPHYMMGVRIDRFLGPSLTWWFKKLLPRSLYPAYFTGLYHILGNHRGIGMPKPDHLMMTCLPTVTESLPNRIGDGKIKLVPDVKSINGNTVELTDGSSIEVDAIIYATGYHTTLPFLDRKFFEVRENRVPLFQRIFMPGTPNIAFVGMFQAIRWGFLDIMENQAKLIADYFAGDYVGPGEEDMRKSIADDQARVSREFMHTLRNNYYLHGDVYIREINQEHKKGGRRAAQSASSRPFPCGSDVTSLPAGSVSPLVSAAE